jgi:hypothetical protein
VTQRSNTWRGVGWAYCYPWPGPTSTFTLTIGTNQCKQQRCIQDLKWTVLPILTFPVPHAVATLKWNPHKNHDNDYDNDDQSVVGFRLAAMIHLYQLDRIPMWLASKSASSIIQSLVLYHCLQCGILGRQHHSCQFGKSGLLLETTTTTRSQPESQQLILVMLGPTTPQEQ